MSLAQRKVTRLDDQSVAALRAWADIDRFQLPEVPGDNDEGWSAVGELNADVEPLTWPPRPEKSPEKQQKVLDTRVMFGCMEVTSLESLLDRMFSDDERFVQTGVRVPKKRTSGTGGKALTCRGSFRVDDNGGLVADSFSYSPLIDFARYIEHNRNQAISMQKLVAKALTWIETREADLEEIWQSISSSGVFGYQAVDQVVSKVRVKGDRSRFVTQWIWPDAQPQGQLPAFFREDLLAAASGSTSALLGDFMSGRPG